MCKSQKLGQRPKGRRTRVVLTVMAGYAWIHTAAYCTSKRQAWRERVYLQAAREGTQTVAAPAVALSDWLTLRGSEGTLLKVILATVVLIASGCLTHFEWGSAGLCCGVSCIITS